MKIGIDLDGVVFNTEMLWATLAEIYDFKELKRNSIIKEGEPRVQEKYNWSTKELDDYLNRYIDLEEFDIMPGAKEVLKLLKDEGNELIVITARGELQNSKKGLNIARQKLDSANIKFDKYYWKQKEKLQTCKNENIDIMIDDNYHICEEISKEGIIALYFRGAWTKKVEENRTLKQVTNWGEVYRFIHELEK